MPSRYNVLSKGRRAARILSRASNPEADELEKKEGSRGMKQKRETIYLDLHGKKTKQPLS